mmetsp:Transcript_6102/g.12756  ORF Transcript_6102/g.12756 Transcript_6102/m.12756 type:complete len:213 (-) Transcript_6102:484-1122(-)
MAGVRLGTTRPSATQGRPTARGTTRTTNGANIPATVPTTTPDVLVSNPPKAQGRVERSTKDEFAIGTEPNEANGWIAPCVYGLQTFSRHGIPYPDQTVVTARHYARTVTVEVYSRHGIRMSRQSADAVPTPNVPNFHRLVEATTDQQIRLGIERAAKDEVGMALELNQRVPGPDVPNSQVLIVRRGGQIFRRPGPRAVVDAAGVTLEGLNRG